MRVLCTILLCWVAAGCIGAGAAASEIEPAHLDRDTLAVIFSGSETLHYAVSWSGGVKIGDIYMRIEREEGKDDGFVISAKVKDYGPLKILYPVDDTFTCFVAGPMKLPFRYEVHQKEGFGREITRLTRYDQPNRLVWYQKNREPEQLFEISGTVYNEFASFVITRALALQEGEAIVVPTFADKQRHEVAVELVRRERRRTAFGNKDTLVVHPKMRFKGLYEKSGNTVLWLTDDRCRVPVEISSKIVIGSLVAELVAYTNSACPELNKESDRR